jgi:hypothetical protein
MKTRIKWTQELFIREAERIHEGKFDYSKTEFKTINDKVEVRCSSNAHEGEVATFHPIAGDHIRKGTGCPRCKSIALAKRIKEVRGLTLESFLNRAKDVHGDRYDYSEVVVTRANDPVKVTCREHGPFYPTPQNHLNSGTGCPECGKESSREKRVLSITDFVARSEVIHGKKYDYSNVTYSKLHDFITICCPIHGDFHQVAYDHLAGHGCSKCAETITGPHREIVELLERKGIRCESEVKVNGWQIDILCSDLNIGIEYNGLRWHSETFRGNSAYHLTKTLSAEQAGVHLIHVWEDDWLYSKQKTSDWLLRQLGISETKLNARSLRASQISWTQACAFVSKYHMQGQPSPCEYCYGLFEGGVLQAAMLLSKKTRSDLDEKEVCLERFCSAGSIRGGFSKLLKAFLRDHEGEFSRVVSFSDRSWSKGEVYAKNGFSLISHSSPRYWWVKGQRRFDRRGFQRKYLAEKLENFNPELSEAKNCYANGYSKLYDCGISKWVLEL